MLAIISYFSCQEPFPLDNLDSSAKIPVIEGMVKNDTGPHQLILYYAVPYNEDSRKRISITGATVYVKDDLGNTFNYHEKSTGLYLSDPKTFCGIIGRSYTLFIEMPDGKILKSEPELLRDTLRVQYIIKRNETKEEYIRNKDNQIVTREIQGQSNYVVLDSSYMEKAYYRLISYYLVYAESQIDTFYYKWVSVNNIDYEFLIDSIVFTKCTHVNSENALPKIGIYNPANPDENIELSFFIRGDKYYVSDENATIVSKSLFSYIYNISPGAYNYYEALNNQLNATSRIYDPLPTQLTGNMHCINDSNQVVLGFFEVSSYTLHKSDEFPHKISCYDSVAVSIRMVY